MRHRPSILPLALAVGLVSADTSAAEGPAAGTGFALGLYLQLAPGDGNVFLSPYSVSSGLAVLAAGARGETARQMAATLGGTPEDLARGSAELSRRLGARDKPYELSVANALWVERSFEIRPAFSDAAIRGWGARVFEIDFRGGAEPSRVRINEWVAEQTRQRIRDLLTPGAVNAATRLVLTNAVHFKAKWLTPFPRARTSPGPFTRADGTRVQSPMMRNPELSARYGAIDGVTLLEMSYVGGDLTFVAILPDPPGSLAATERGLDATRLARWDGALREQVVDVVLPRFRIETLRVLGAALSALGMPDAFDQARADFGGIAAPSQGGRLFVSAAVQKAFVEVDEEGTEAAAATGIVASVVWVPRVKAQFHADRPFLFLIRDRATRTILFAGRLGDPTSR